MYQLPSGEWEACTTERARLAWVVEAERLQAENDELRSDAERYRWLKENTDPILASVMLNGVHEEWDGIDEEIDASISRANKAKNEATEND